MRDKRLDVLRFLAIILVLGRHTSMYLPNENTSVITDFFFSWQKYGWVGVDLFFVLSGFLISNLIFKETLLEKFSIKRFLIRRELKIYPPFFILILCTVCFNLIRSHPFSCENVLSELIFIQNYSKGLWTHTWSLAVEEHFYLMFPVIVYFLARYKRVEWLPWILGLISLVVLMLRLTNPKLGIESDEKYFVFPSHLRIDSFVPGILWAYAKNYRIDLYEKISSCSSLYLIIPFIISIITLGIFPYQHPFLLTFGLSIISVGFASLLIVFLKHDLPDNRFIRFISYLGENSYQIYLWHMAVLFWGISFIHKFINIEMPYYIVIPLFMVLSFVVGIVMSKLIEQPVLKIRQKISP